MKNRLSIRKLSNENDIKSILENIPESLESESITPKEKELLASYNNTKIRPQKTPLNIISNQILSHKANIAIIQRPVQDPDFFAEHHLYYSKQFQHVSQFCTRVHFFYAEKLSIESPDPIDPISFIDELSNQNAKYIGFVTLRPIRFSPIGATILLPPANSFITCRDKFDVHLAGRTFSVEGTPFMQQDNAVGACAQTAIWVALRTVRRRDEHKLFTPGQINIAASEASLITSRMLPNREGLNVNQIAEIFQMFGYSTHVLDIKNIAPVADEQDVIEALPKEKRSQSRIHSYIESSIPVILILERNNDRYQHAVVVVGHGPIRMAAAITSECAIANIKVNGLADNKQNSIRLFNSFHWIDGFIVQNDTDGPYTKLANNAIGGEYAFEHAKYAIPLLPTDIFMTAEEAEVVSIRLLKWLIPISSPGQFVLRVYLCSRHELREWAMKEKNLSPTAARYYREQTFPRRLWVAEICYADNYGQQKSSDNRRFGEIVLDASADHHEAPFLLVHFNLSGLNGHASDGIMYRREIDCDSGAEHMRIEFIEDEKFYPPMVRGQRC